MNDRCFLMWLHERLEKVHGEDACYDYMHKLRAIIKATPEDRYTPNMGTGNGLNELKALMANCRIEGDERR